MKAVLALLTVTCALAQAVPRADDTQMKGQSSTTPAPAQTGNNQMLPQPASNTVDQVKQPEQQMPQGAPMMPQGVPSPSEDPRCVKYDEYGSGTRWNCCPADPEAMPVQGQPPPMMNSQESTKSK